MRKLGTWFFAIGALAVWTAPALAQRGGGFGMMGGINLLRNTSVQKELKLDSSQVEKVTALANSLSAKRREEFQKIQDLPEADRPAKRRALMAAAAKEDREALKPILSAEQLKRFDQITLQQRGISAFTEPEVAAKLKLTDEQKSKLQQMAEDFRGQMREVFQKNQGNFEEARKEMATLRKESMDKATALLSADQKMTWKELTGEPFEIRFEPRNN
jgi:hypothetical protein